nr:BTAD domain-containing putative transcriptional regulator [Kibdelosporangium phytohabitans]
MGPVRAWCSEGERIDLGSTGQRAVLGLLALHGGQGMSRAELIDALWGRRPPATAVNILQTRVKHLRRQLEPGRAPRAASGVLPRTGDGYTLLMDSDLTRFRELAPSSDALSVRRALQLWHGAPLSDIPALAGHPTIRAVARERHAVVIRYGEMMIARGAAADVLPMLAEAAADQPLDEAVHARLIRAYQATGRRAEAFAVFHAIRKRLAHELGSTPGRDLTAANEDILRGCPPGFPVTAASPASRPVPADAPEFGRSADGIRIQALGPLRLWRHGRVLDLGSGGVRALLGILALDCGQPTSRADIAEALWHEEPPPSATNVIQAYVRKLRRLLEPDRHAHGHSSLVPRSGDGYTLLVSDVDVPHFRMLLEGGGTERLGAALRLWQGPPVADVPALAGHKKVLALTEQRRAAVARYGEVMIRSGSSAEVIGMLEDEASGRPLDEAALARLIRAYRAAGRSAQAFDAYRTARQRLADELGVDPGPELIAARPSERAVPAQLPAGVRGFVGRGAELSELDNVLALHGADGVVCLVSGSAGVGKTAFAVRAGHRRQRFPGGQLYIDMRGFDSRKPLAAGDALVRLLGALGVTGRDVPADTAGRGRWLRQEITGKGVLLVVDNVSAAGQVLPLLPCPRSCAIVVTSRDTLPELTTHCHVELGPLSRAEALTLLTNVVGERARAEPEAAAALVEQCARLPLALRVAAELVVSRTVVPLSGLVKELADRDRRLELFDDSGDHRTAVGEVFSWSYRHLSDAAARAFRLLALHPGLDTDTSAAAALFGTGTSEARRLLETLARAHLVHATGADRWGMHDLLRAFGSALGNDDQEALGRLFDHYVETAAGMAVDLESTASRTWLDAELPNLTTICVYTPPRQTVRLATALYRYLDGGRYAEAQTIHAQAVQAALRLNDLSAQAHAVTNLGSVHWHSGRYGEAAQHYRRALRMYLAASNRAGAARALTRLGNVEEQTGQYQHAATHHAQALAHARAAKHVSAEARALTNLGIVSERLDELDTAADLHEQALDVFVSLGDWVGEAVARTRLGMIAMRTGAYERAMRQHERALAIARDSGHLRGEAHSLINIGDVHLARNFYARAATHYSDALALCELTGHEYGRATALNGLGDAFDRTGRRTEARRNYTAALAVAVKIGDVDEQGRAHAGLAR